MARDDWRWEMDRDRDERERDRRSGRDYEGYDLRDRDWRNWEERNRRHIGGPGRNPGAIGYSYGETGGGYGGYGALGRGHEREGMGAFAGEHYGRDTGSYGHDVGYGRYEERDFGGFGGERPYGRGRGMGGRGMGPRYDMGRHGRGPSAERDDRFMRDWNDLGFQDRDPYYREWNRGERGGREDEGFFTRMGRNLRDMLSPGERRGRGPKNYRRSDDRIRDDIYDCLLADPWIDSSDVEINVSNAEVTLTGFVTNRRDKRRIEDIAEDVLGVEDVHNQIRVRREEQRTETTDTTTRGRTPRPDRTAQAK